MTNDITVDEIREVLRRVYSASIVIGNLPKSPAFDGKVFLIDDVEVKRIDRDLHTVSDVLIKALYFREKLSVKPQILDATIHEATVPAYKLQQANCLHENLKLEIHRVCNEEATILDFDEVNSIIDYGDRRFEAGKAAAIKSALDLRIEIVAKLVYQTWHLMDGFVSWQDGGNSNMQEKARDLARKYVVDEMNRPPRGF